MIVASGPEFIEDVRKAPDTVLSVKEPRSDVRVVTSNQSVSSCSQWISQFLQKDYTLDILNTNDPYHVHIIRTRLTRNIAVTFKEVQEEVIHALKDLIPTDEHGER